MQNLLLKKLTENIWEIPKQNNMKVPGRIYANEKLLPQIQSSNALKQVINVARLPGIMKYSLAMPDIHWGYGFPIGGVAAMDIYDGVISPGGVGYDINCGVRLIKTNLFYEDIKDDLTNLINTIFQKIPAGVGSKNPKLKLHTKELDKVLEKGAEWAIENGYGSEIDLEKTEEYGRLDTADASKVSDRAKKRGINQLGTLGSGNHFVEIGKVHSIFNDEIGKKLNLEKNQIVVLIHTGSRGLGHQICDDYVHKMLHNSSKRDFKLPDRQLAAVYFNSKLGKDYYAAMSAAANFAWNNRQIIMALVKEAFIKTLDIDEHSLAFNLIYDVCHNIAKIEEHKVEDKIRKLCVHRKGATRAFGPGNALISDLYRDIGQPVIIPGDMGTESYLCVGTKKAMAETFGSSCHGAGRVMSRNQARKRQNKKQVFAKMKKLKILVRAASKKTVQEEMSFAYKDVREVIKAISDAGIIKKVAKTIPLGVIKG